MLQRMMCLSEENAGNRFKQNWRTRVPPKIVGREGVEIEEDGLKEQSCKEYLYESRYKYIYPQILSEQILGPMNYIQL